MPILARPSRASDAPELALLCHRPHGGQSGVPKLLETALLCFTAEDSDTGQVVGFLCIDDSPSARLGSKASGAWLDEVVSTHKVNPNTSAFIWEAACVSDYELEASGVLLKAAFLSMASLNTLLLVVDGDITFTEPGLAAICNRVAHDREGGSYMFETTRSVVLPPLTIRRARVEDHDDLVPVLDMSEKRYPALAKLPDSCRPQEAFALSRLVAGQDEKNCVLVAMSGKKLVGFMVLTSDVDTSVLLESFDLHPFDNFLPQSAYDFQYQAAKNTVHDQKLQALKEKLAEAKGMRKAHDASTETDEALTGEGEPREGQEGEPHAEAGSGAPEAEPEFDLEAAAAPTEDEIRQEMQSMFADWDDEEPTLIAITMFCVLEEYEAQALEFMQHAFDSFTDKDYCVVTLPHNSEEPSLMANMTRVAPMPGAAFPEVLYLFNRNALLDGFEVRLATAGDAEGVNALVSGMPNSEDISSAFTGSQEKSLAIVACCQGEVVGLVTICDVVDLALLSANYDLTTLISMDHHAPERHAEVDILCMNPIFAHKHRELLAGAQRLLKRTCLYYALPPGQPPPDMLEVLQQVPPRHSSVSQDKQAGFALYMFTRKAAFFRKRTVNAQIVVVGASECGLATVERLLLNSQLSFNYITLLAPGGISVGGVACEYTASLITRLGLEARLSLVDAELIGLDVQQRVAELSDGSQLGYDLLLVTSGVQEQTRTELGKVDPDVVQYVVNARELQADFSLDTALSMEDILVYGDTLDAYQALATLEKTGAKDKAAFFAPEGERSKLVDVLMDCAQFLGRQAVPLQEPRRMNLTGLHNKEGTPRPRAHFQGPGGAGEEEHVLDLLVACRKPDVSPWVFACLNDAGIVYDGRIVVDGAFRTSDPSVYASGTAAKLSRRYGRNVHFEHYNSKECGHKLADSVAASFLGTQQPDEAPTLKAARAIGCQVPGNMVFMMAGTPAVMMHPTLEAPVGGRRMQTLTDRGFMAVVLDAEQRVLCAAYLGKNDMQMPASKLSSIVGLHVAYLNDLLAKHQAGEVEDLTLFFSEAWTEALFNDGFADLRSQLHAVLKAEAAVGLGVEELEGQARTLVFDFVKAHISQIPGFKLPA